MRRTTRTPRKLVLTLALACVSAAISIAAPLQAFASGPSWNESTATSVPDSGAPTGIVKTLTGDVTGDGAPDQVAITSSKQIWIGVYNSPGSSTALTWTQWTPPSVSGLSLATLQNNTYLGAGDPLRNLDSTGNTAEDPIIRDGLTIIVPAAETGSGHAEYWYYHSFGTGFEAPDKSNTGAYTADEVLTGDFNGDGRMDFLLINNTTDVWQVVLGSVIITPGTTYGQQTYEPATTWLSGYGVGTFDLVGDFTGDGVDDVAQFSAGSWRVAVGSPTLAENSFSYSTWLTGVSTPSSARAADFTGTGVDSIVDTYNSTGNWNVLTSQAAAGSLAFASHTSAVGVANAKYLLPGDGNGDGLTDMLVVTSSDTPELVTTSYNAGTDTPTLTVNTSTLSVGTVTSAYQVYRDANDSADLYLKTSTGNFFLTASNAMLASTKTVHLNRPMRGPANTTCNAGNPAIFCGFYSDRADFYMPHRAAFYVRSIQFARDYRSFSGRSIGDSCFYIYPKRYTVGASNDTPAAANREEACDTVEKGTGQPAYGSGAITYPGNGVLVPATSDSRIEVQSSSYTAPTPPAAPVIEHFTAVVGKASVASPSNLDWILRLPEADTSQPIAAGSAASPAVVPITVVPYGGSATANHTEWGNNGTCNQSITGVSFYNSFDQSPYHTEAQLGMYVKHSNGTQDNYSFSPREYKGDDGTVNGSYTSRNAYYFATPVTLVPGDIVGVTSTHYNYANFAYNADVAYYLLMQKATDTSCNP